MPVYNKANTTQEIITRVKAVNLGDVRRDLIIVDGESKDGACTPLDDLRKNGAHKVYFHAQKMGKGTAPRTALINAIGDIVALKRKHKFHGMSISVYSPDFSEGKKISRRDGFTAIWALIRRRFMN